MIKIRNFYPNLLPALTGLVLLAALALWGVTTAYAGWNAPVPANPDSASGVGEYTSLAVVNSRPAISYYDSTNGDLKYVRAANADGSSWGTPVTVDGADDVGEYTSLAVVNGNPAISYYDSTNGDLKYVRAADADGSSWGSPVAVDSTGDVGEYTSLAVVNGNPAISYYDSANGELKYVQAANADGSSWGSPVTVDSASSVGEYTSLAVVNGNPAISYYDGYNGNLKYVRAANADGSSWGTPITVDGDWYGGEYTSLVVVNGNPAISYYDGYNGNLKYVRATDADGSSWGSPVTVDSAGDVGEYTSLVVVNNYPAISYYDSTNGELKYARATNADGSSWGSPVTVNSPGGGGEYTSLAVVNGYPAISYYDSANSRLKYLYFIPAPEIAVLGNGVVIANGDASPRLADDTTFLALAGGATTHTFTLSNSGELDLNLTGSPRVAITGPAAADFSAVVLPTTPVSANSSTTFQVRFAPAVAGTRVATLTIANNDLDENPYAFAIQGNICTNAITVQNTNDSGPGSLRQALVDICDGGTINFATDTTITLASPLQVDRRVFLTGQGHAVTISGNDAVRVFTVLADTHVTFDSLTIAHGKTTTPEVSDYYAVGGGLRIEPGSVVTLTHSAVLSNTTVYYYDDGGWSMYTGLGGGIYNLGALTVISSTFSNNIAAHSTDWGDGAGGAIYNKGTLQVTDSSFSGNSATWGAGISSNGSLTVQNSHFSGNSSPCGGAAIAHETGTANVSDSTIADNVAPGSWCEGGAAGISNRFGTMTISRSTISGNISEGSSGGGLSSYGTGSNLGRLTVIDSTIYSNTAHSHGGGIYNWWDSVLTVTNSSIYSNTAGYYGGGILSGPHANTKLTLINSTLSHNTAQDGGGLYNGNPGYPASVLTMINNTVVSNTATGSGGGFYNRDSANATLDNIILWGNTAPTGPQIYNYSTNRPTISYSDIQNSGGSGTGWDTSLGTDGGNNIDADPLLGPLANNGGDTLTHALLSGSGAIDTGNAATCPATDQRGAGRPQGAGCDIGAYEAGLAEISVLGNAIVITDGDGTPSADDHTDFGSVTLGGALTRTFTISNSGGAVLDLTGAPLVSITGPASPDFSLTVSPTTPVDPNRTTTFQVRFTPSVSSTQVVTLTIANNDDDENPYEFAIQGTGTNQAPVADAGGDQSATVGTVVTLDGSDSTDPDGHVPLSYGWTQTGGPAVTLSSATAVSPTFTAPGTPTVLTFTLRVTDAYGLAASAADEVVVTVHDVPVSDLVVTADGPTILGQVTAFTVTAQGSNLTYTWNFGDGSPVISGPSPTITHTYPAIATYTAVVTATNGSNSQQVSIPVRIRSSEVYIYLPLVQNAYTTASGLEVAHLPLTAPTDKGMARNR